MANKRNDHDHPAAHGQPSRPAHGQATEEAETDESPPALGGGRVKSSPPPPPPIQAFPQSAPGPARATSTASPPIPPPPAQAYPEGVASARAARPEAVAAAPGSGDDERIEYRPNRKVHICEAGPVALGNWVGRVGTKFVRVYRGAQASALPGPVVAAMKESNVDVGLVTYEEMGLRQPPATTLLRR